MISIQPKWCELIALGKKTVDVRKTRPKLETPFKCYIYCTEGDSLAYPCDNNPKFAIHRTNNGTLQGRRMTIKEREHSDHLYANGKVIGEFVCDNITWANGLDFVVKEDAEATLEGTCLTKEEIYNYLGVKSGMSRYDKKTEFYRWHISDLVIYDKPKKLSEFGLKRAPQSWCYVKKKTNEK